MSANRTIMIELVEGTAKFRNDPAVPRDFITEALERIEAGQEKVSRYPTGAPTLKGVYEVAARMYREHSVS